jgi:hypothetical protein
LLIVFVFVEGASPKAVAVPISAPEAIVPLVVVVYLNVDEVGVAVTVKVPCKTTFPVPAIVTLSPTKKP